MLELIFTSKYLFIIIATIISLMLICGAFYLSKSKLLILNLVFLLLSSSFIYYKIGNLNSLDKLDILQSDVHLTKQNKIRNISDEIKRELYKLEYMVVENSKDKNAWWKLAKLYQMLKEHKKAEAAFKTLYELDNKDNYAFVQYAISNSEANDGILDKKLLIKTEKLSNKYPALLNVLAIDAFKRKDFSKAINNWEALKNIYMKSNYSKDNKSLDNINKMLELARKSK